MATVLKTLNSFKDFGDLARALGCKNKAQQLKARPAFAQVRLDCGWKAAVIWSIFQDMESSKRYGPRGKIVLSPEEIVKMTDYSYEVVAQCLAKLVGKEHLRLAWDGEGRQAVKAA